jgi:hypothetical protein
MPEPNLPQAAVLMLREFGTHVSRLHDTLQQRHLCEICSHYNTFYEALFPFHVIDLLLLGSLFRVADCRLY